MADADSDSDETTSFAHKYSSKEAARSKRKGKHTMEVKESQRKGGMSKPGRAVIVTGGNTHPPYDDTPANISPDDKDLVMEYSDMFEPSKSGGFIDIQEGDAILESSDTEVVAHTNENLKYGNEATDSGSDSGKDSREGPPPFDDEDDKDFTDNDDDDDDDASEENVDGPPPLDSDEEDISEGEEQLASTSPEKGSTEDLLRKEVQAGGVKGIKGLGSESNSDDEVREAPPPLDSDNDEETKLLDSIVVSSRGIHAESIVNDSHGSHTKDLENIYDDDDDGGDGDDAETMDDDANDVDDNDDGDGDNDSGRDDSGDDLMAGEEQSSTAVAMVTEDMDDDDNDDDDDDGDGDEATESKSLLPQSQSNVSKGTVDDDVSDDNESDDETAALLTKKETAANSTVVKNTVGYGHEVVVSGLDEDEKFDLKREISGDENSDEEIVLPASEQRPPSVSTKGGLADKSSDKDSSESPECVPQEDENELEWDVEDFDIPKHASSKVNTEAMEVQTLKKSFLDTLKSEAEQTANIQSADSSHKAVASKKGKAVSDSAKTNTLKTERKPVRNTLKSDSEKEIISEREKSKKKANRDVPVKTVKTEKKGIKGSLKNVSKNADKPLCQDSKSRHEKVKLTEKNQNLQKTEGHRVENAKEEAQRTVKEQSVVKEAISRPSKPKSPTVKSTTASVHQSKVMQVSSAKEKKKSRPVSEPVIEQRSRDRGSKERVNTSYPKQEVKKQRKSDSHTTSEAAAKQKPHKASSAEAILRQKGASEAVYRERPKSAVENGEVKKTKSKRSSTKSIAVGTDSDNDFKLRRSDLTSENSDEYQTKPRAKLATNGHFSSFSSRDKLSLQGDKYGDHRQRDGHGHDRGKHVWLCRDDEIHKLIAQKASLLKEYESGSLGGRKVFASHKSSYRKDEDPTDLPDVRFVSNKQPRRQTRPMSEAFPERAPYSSRRKEQRRSLQLSYSGSSSDEDERTNRQAKSKRGGTFAVGLAARSTELKEDSDSDHEETCEFCAAEKMSWDAYVKDFKQAVSQKHEFCPLPLQLIQTFHLPPGPFCDPASNKAREKNLAWEGPHHPRNLLLGVVYTAKYLGSSQIMSPQAPNKAVRMEQAQEAVGRIKVPEGEDQPTTDVDLFISTERIKIVNASTKEVMLDHALRTVSFIADIGDVLVLMARQMPDEQSNPDVIKPSQILASVGTAQTDHKNIKITCHVFQSPEAQVIAKSIGQAFNVAYQEFLRQNGLSEDVIEDAEYNGVLEAQKILGEDLTLLSDENQAKEAIINKKPAEMLGIMIVESGWGSMIPCAIVAHLAKDGPAAKSGRLNVGDQILSVNGTSLVGLPLSECQNIIKSIRPLTKVVMKVVSCPPTVQVVVNRPDTKYQLGFSVQNGMICSLMRGSIAERGGVRVGHRIIEINGESVVATSHQHIVELLATTVGEIRMKTMPASMYRLLVGLEAPQHI